MKSERSRKPSGTCKRKPQWHTSTCPSAQPALKWSTIQRLSRCGLGRALLFNGQKYEVVQHENTDTMYYMWRWTYPGPSRGIPGYTGLAKTRAYRHTRKFPAAWIVRFRDRNPPERASVVADGVLPQWNSTRRWKRTHRGDISHTHSWTKEAGRETAPSAWFRLRLRPYTGQGMSAHAANAGGKAERPPLSRGGGCFVGRLWAVKRRRQSRGFGVLAARVLT